MDNEDDDKDDIGDESNDAMEASASGHESDDQRHSGSDNDQDNEDNQQAESSSQEDVLARFAETDFIVEPAVFAAIASYFQSGGSPEPVVKLLSQNYVGLAQLCNLMGDWLVDVGSSAREVQAIFEQHLSTIIAKHFQPKRADQIFDQQSGEFGIDWLPDLIAHAPWRALLYRLTEDYADCLMLNFAVKLISDAGFQHEISNVTTAAQQLEIFSRVLSTAIDGVLQQTADTRAFHTALTELIRVACHSDYTYLYTQCLLHVLAQQEHGTKGGAAAAIKFLSQTLRTKAPVIQDTTPISLALINCTGTSRCNPAILQAMQSMLSKQALNPADITLLHTCYNNNDPPPIQLIRDPVFIDLLIDSLFAPRGVKLHPDHRPKYIFLLAFATCAQEYSKKGSKKLLYNKDEVQPTEGAIDKMSALCQGKSDTASNEILAELQIIFLQLKHPVVSAGVLHWIRCTVSEREFFQLHPEPVPVHFCLLDEIATLHQQLHPQVFKLLTSLFVKMNTEATEGVAERLMGRQRTFIDRLVHLLSVGYALPVTEFFLDTFREGNTDTSLIRYFVTETLDIIGPPYEADFINLFLPLVDNAEIVDFNVAEKVPAAKEFLEVCKSSAEAD